MAEPLVLLSAKTESSRMQTEGYAGQLTQQLPPDGTTFQ